MQHAHRAPPRLARLAWRAGLATLAAHFACQSGPAAPTLASVSPAVQEQGKFTPLTLGGHFDPQVGVSFVSPQDTFVHTEYRVYFGASALANVAYVDDRTLTATLPNDAPPGTYDVEVVAPGASFSHLAAGLTILPSASSDPNSNTSRAIQAVLAVTPLAGDTNTVFNGDASASSDPQNPTKKLYVAWDWQGNGHYTALGNTNAHRFAGPGTYNVHVVVFEASGARADAYVTVVVAAAGRLLEVQDASDTSGGDGLSLRQALSQASNARQPTVIAAARPLRIVLTSPLSLSGGRGVMLQGSGLVLDGSHMGRGARAGLLRGDGGAPACLNVVGDGHRVSGVEFQHCDLAVRIDGQSNVLANLYVHDSNTAVIATGKQNWVGPNNHFAGLLRLGVSAQSPTRVFNNIIEGMGDAGIELWPASRDSHVQHNILAHNTFAIRLQPGARAIHLWNNTLDAAGIGIEATGAQDIDLRNNILMRLGVPLTNVAAFGNCDGNDFFNNPNDVRCPQAANNRSVDPRFVTVGACGAYTLGDDSPLTQAGVAISGAKDLWVGACGP